jgi:hypothetical protein
MEKSELLLVGDDEDNVKELSGDGGRHDEPKRE